MATLSIILIIAAFFAVIGLACTIIAVVCERPRHSWWDTVAMTMWVMAAIIMILAAEGLIDKGVEMIWGAAAMLARPKDFFKALGGPTIKELRQACYAEIARVRKPMPVKFRTRPEGGVDVINPKTGRVIATHLDGVVA